MTGLNAQFGVAAETTYGTRVTVSRFYPLVNESLVQDIERLESEGIIAGSRVIRSEQWGSGRSTIEGDIGLELFQQHTGLLFEHMLGSITSSTAGGVSTHTVTPGSLFGKSLTVQIGKPDINGIVAAFVQPFTYAGVKVKSWELACETGEIVTLGLGCVAQTETTGVAIATASYGADGGRPFRYVHGSVLLAGTTVCVRGITVNGENPMDTDRECIGQAFIDQPIENDLRVYGGTVNLEFNGLTQYQRFLNGTEAAMVLSFSASATAQATLTMNARFDGITPTVKGKELLMMEVPFKCIASTTQDSSAISFTLKNVQTTP
jgi:hypothetical protein